MRYCCRQHCLIAEWLAWITTLRWWEQSSQIEEDLKSLWRKHPDLTTKMYKIVSKQALFLKVSICLSCWSSDGASHKKSQLSNTVCHISSQYSPVPYPWWQSQSYRLSAPSLCWTTWWGHLKSYTFVQLRISGSGKAVAGCGSMPAVGSDIRQDETHGSFQPSELYLPQVHFFLTPYSLSFFFSSDGTCYCPVSLCCVSSASIAFISFPRVFLRTNWQEADLSMLLCPSSHFPVPAHSGRIHRS